MTTRAPAVLISDGRHTHKEGYFQLTWGHQAITNTTAYELDIDGAVEGAPVLESRESIHEDTFK